MRWESEKWRKLYRRVDAAWARLPVLARGLGSELLKYADDDGRIPVRADEETGEAVCCLMGARRAEWKAIEACVQALLDDGYIIREGEAILIRNFAKAQARSSNAERQARYRQRHQEDGDDSAGEEPAGVTGDTNSNATATVTSNGRNNAAVTAALPNEVTDRALSLSLSLLSDHDRSLVANSGEEVSVTAYARDGETHAKAGERAASPALSQGAKKTRAKARKPPPPEHPIPVDWEPTDAHRAYCAKHGVDLDIEEFGFRGWAEGKTAVSWNGTFTTRLSNRARWNKQDREERDRRRASQAPSVQRGGWTREDAMRNVPKLAEGDEV